MKKVGILLLAVLLVVATCTTAFAMDETKQEVLEAKGTSGLRYTYISSAACNLTISYDGYTQMSARIMGFSNVDSTRISVYLQREVGGSWQTVQHWVQTSSTFYDYWGASRFVTSGYDYRLRVYFYAYDGTDYEVTSLTSYESY